MLKKLGCLTILLGTAFAALAFQVPTNKQDPDILEKIEFINNKSELSLDNVRNIAPSQWKTSHTKNINIGFSQDHYWFKITLDNLTASDTPYFLRSKYPLLDTLDLYLFSDSALLQEFHIGDALPFDHRPVDHPSLIFPLNIRSDNEYTIYMHVHTAGTLQLSLSLHNESDFWQELWSENTIRAVFYAALLSMIFYNAFIFFILLERAYLYYVLYLTSFTLFMANMHGWAFKLFWPNSPNINEFSLTCIIGILILNASLFTASFLRLKEVNPSAYRITITFAKLGGLSSILSLFSPYSSMAQASLMLTIALAAIVILITIHAVIYSRRREVIIFIFSWISMLIGFILYAAQKFGALPINTFTEYSIEIGGVIVALLLSLGLAERINIERKIRMEAQKKLLEVQRLANDKLDKKVQERTAELKIINNQLQTASITDSLTQIKNRHYFDYKLTAEYRRAYREKSEISLLMLDIDHFKKFNDNYGHQAGDEVLRRVAAAIQNIVNRPGDTAFRYGGEEFSVLLPSTPKEGAYTIADSIRKHVKAMPFQWQGETLSVTISIGVASCIPSHSQGELMLLKQADNALYLAKDRGRDRVSYPEDVK